MADPNAAPTGIDLSGLLGGLLSAGGLGLSASNQQQAYNGLQGALNTIGPTSLNGFSLTGPGGVTSGYSPNGTASINLGQLNPAFNGLTSAANGGLGSYAPGLPGALSSNALGTLGLSNAALGSAYNGYSAGLNAAGNQLNSLGDFNSSYNNLLGAFRAQSAPGIQQNAFGLQNTLFGNGVADSTGATSGSLAAQNFGRGVSQADASNQLNAFQGALGQQQAAANNFGTLTNSANGLLTGALNNFGNTNQLISGLNTASLNNSLSALQGASGLNTLGLNNFNSALQTGTAQGTVRNQSLFPFAQLATSLAGTQNGGSILAKALSGAGSSLLGGSSGLNSLFSGLGNLFSGLNSNGTFTPDQQSINDQTGQLLNDPGLQAQPLFPVDDGSQGFNSASGEATNSPSPSQSNGSGLGLSSLGTGIGLIKGIASGSPTGFASAGLDATKLGAKAGLFGADSGAVGTSAGEGLSALGVYSGLEQGGVAGDSSAAVSAAQLGSQAGLFGGASSAVGTGAGYVAAPLAIYNAANNYQSGKTGTDTVNDAEAGASVGSIFGPYGAAIGGVIGGAVGALSSLAGPGAKDPETVASNSLINFESAHGNDPQIAANVPNPYLQISGLFDTRSSDLPMYQQYGRKGEAQFTNDLVSKINGAVGSDPSLKNDPTAVYNKVVAPWINSMGNGWKNVGSTYTATAQGLVQDMVKQYMSGTADTHWYSADGSEAFANIYSNSPFTSVLSTQQQQEAQYRAAHPDDYTGINPVEV